MIRILTAIAAGLALAAPVRGDEPSVGPVVPGSGSLSRGLGQVASGWSHDGVHGQELAERIHWLQQVRDRDPNQLQSFRDRGGVWQKQGDRWVRERHEERRAIAREEHHPRGEERRRSEERSDLHRDLADYRRDHDRDHDRHGNADRDDRRDHDRDRDQVSRHDRDRDRDRDRDHERARDRDDRGYDHSRGKHQEVATGHNEHGPAAKHEDAGRHTSPSSHGSSNTGLHEHSIPSPMPNRPPSGHTPEASHNPSHSPAPASHAPSSKSKTK